MAQIILLFAFISLPCRKEDLSRKQLNARLSLHFCNDTIFQELPYLYSAVHEPFVL